MNSHTVYLPFPSKNLSPNARPHWAKLAAAKKAYKLACGWKATADGLRTIDADALDVMLTFYPPDRRHYDLDNLISRMKAGLDAISGVVGIDDRHFTLEVSRASFVIEKHGMVKVDLNWTPREAKAA